MTNKRKNIIFIAAVLAAAAVLWLVCRTGGSGHTAVLRYGTPQTEQRIDLRRDADYDIDTGRYTIHLHVENGGIAFVDSPCPDHLCEGFGVLKNEGETHVAMKETTAYFMNQMLTSVVNAGTGTSAKFSGMTIAGKTGTTSSNRDRWFCGYTTHYTAAVWCGYDIPEQIYLTGSSANPAARLWKAVMQPIHDGLPREGLYNGNAFHSVGVCLDSGKKATAACSADVRGLERVVYVNVYDDDEPEGTCDKHIQVDYCVTGGGVATDYCYMFSDAQIESRSLVKLTQAEVDEIKAADGFGLNDIYTANYYVYLIDSDGNPASWHGFYNNLNNGVDAPYIMCPLHNQSSWEEYQPGGTEEDTTGGWDNSSDGGWHGGWDGFVG